MLLKGGCNPLNPSPGSVSAPPHTFSDTVILLTMLTVFVNVDVLFYWHFDCLYQCCCFVIFTFSLTVTAFLNFTITHTLSVNIDVRHWPFHCHCYCLFHNPFLCLSLSLSMSLCHSISGCNFSFFSFTKLLKFFFKKHKANGQSTVHFYLYQYLEKEK